MTTGFESRNKWATLPLELVGITTCSPNSNFSSTQKRQCRCWRRFHCHRDFYDYISLSLSRPSLSNFVFVLSIMSCNEHFTFSRLHWSFQFTMFGEMKKNTSGNVKFMRNIFPQIYWSTRPRPQIWFSRASIKTTSINLSQNIIATLSFPLDFEYSAMYDGAQHCVIHTRYNGNLSMT